jgi:hypothetical protein
VPVPRAHDLGELNARLLAACRADEARTVDGREQTVGAAMAAERAHLLPLAAEPFDLAEVSFPTVNRLGCVRVQTNAYSVPLPAGTAVQARLTADALEAWHAGRRVARHERSYGRHREVLELDHYLDVLARKPGALAGSTPLARWRRLGRWPASYDRLWAGLTERLGAAAAAREMVGLLQVGRRYGHDRLRTAVEAALALGCHDAAAVRHLLAADDLAHARPGPVEVGALVRFERPLPSVVEYDRLLAAGVGR